MEYRHDPRTGRLTLTARYSVAALGVTVTRDAGYVWHAGKWPIRIRRPSTAMRAASFWHDAAYEDLPWTWFALSRVDLGFVAIYLRHGGDPARALAMWCGLALWSAITVAARTKPEKWRTR